jgi:flagellar hook-associated protein 3 FlgL
MRVPTSLEFARSLTGITNLRADVNKYQQQVASGKRLFTAAEDPVAASQALSIGERISSLDQFDRNANLASLRLSDQETAIDSATSSLQRVRELVLQGRNRALSADDRRFVNAEVRQRLQEMVSIANTRNASGEYIFAGSAVSTIPFSANGAGGVTYNGDQTSRELPIAEGRTIPEGFTGSEALMGIRNGNGSFVSGLANANTGTGRVINDTVLDPSSFNTDNFSIVFTSANTFDVTNTTSGATILSGQTYTDGAAINFNGSSVAITGKPAVGDAFLISPSQNQSVFTTINNIINALDTTASTSAQGAALSFSLDRGLSDIDQALNKFAELKSIIGGRQNTLDSQLQSNGSLSEQLTKARSTLEDADPVEAISNLARYSQVLEAAQQAFVKVQGLSLFNYLR